jgi:hypothetical protein
MLRLRRGAVSRLAVERDQPLATISLLLVGPQRKLLHLRAPSKACVAATGASRFFLALTTLVVLPMFTAALVPLVGLALSEQLNKRFI